jgi:hypothetical protein
MSAADLPCETLLIAINCSAELGRIINALITHFSTDERHATISVPDKLERLSELGTLACATSVVMSFRQARHRQEKPPLPIRINP